MIGESSASSAVTAPETKASVLITITTPGADTPICRLGNSEEVVRDLTVRQLLERVINPNSLFSVGVPMSQLQAENATALAIGELLSADCCEVVAPGKGAAGDQQVTLDEPARAVAREQVGTQGNRFLNINLEVRNAPDASAPTGNDRRRTQMPQTDEIEPETPVFKGSTIETTPEAASISRFGKASRPSTAKPQATEMSSSQEEKRSDEPVQEPSALAFDAQQPSADASFSKEDESPGSPSSNLEDGTAFLPTGTATPLSDLPERQESELAPSETAVEPSIPSTLSEDERELAPAGGEGSDTVLPKMEAPPPESAIDEAEEGGPEQGNTRPGPKPVGEAPQAGTTNGLFTILAEKPKDEPKQQTRDRKDYARKSDWLRAQFLPEVEALDFSGLFVGNLGFGIREEKGRKNVVLADPARVTEVLLRANGYRRSGDHAKALLCYQELVDMDPSNADFRFLLGKTFVELGQQEEAIEALQRAKELGHDGAEKELEDLKRTGHRPKAALGFLKFWKQ
jgi:hypothetical protein